MTQEQWTSYLASKYGFSKEFALSLLKDIGRQMCKEVTYQGKTALPEFGTFYRKAYPARKSVNPRTGERFESPPKVRCRMREGYELKRMMNPDTE